MLKLKATPLIYLRDLLFIHLVFITCYYGAAATVNDETVMNHFYFQFEKDIPIIPSMIFVYFSSYFMSLILPFILVDQQIKKIVKEVLIATILAAIFFYFFPTQLGFERPRQVESFNFFFQLLYQTDTPNNLLPSLHVTYSLLFSMAIFKELKSNVTKSMTILWFLLLCSSVIFTHQHHLLDIPAGIFLAIFSKQISQRICANSY